MVTTGPERSGDTVLAGAPGPDRSGPSEPTGRSSGGARPQPQRERSGGRLLGLPVSQLLCWEAVAAGIAAALVRRDWVLVPAVAAGLLVFALTLVRVRGRWLWQVIGVRQRYRKRRRLRAVPGVDLRLAAIAELRPELRVDDVEQRRGQHLGVCWDGTAWVSVIAVQPGDDVLADPRKPAWLPVRELAGALVVDDIELAGVQILCHVAPAPSGTLPADSPVATSYAQVKAGRTAASQQVWIALRLDPMRRPDAIETRGGGDEGARRALRRCVARVLELLSAAGVDALALDSEALTTALSTAGMTRPVAVQPGTRRTAETWSGWQADEISHISWWVREWPTRAAPMQLLSDAVAGVPALSCTLSLSLHPAPAGAARFRGLVRLSAISPDTAEAAATALRAATDPAGLELSRLDGEQALGYAATLPLGGGSV
jgi:type VII secretion protein EccE